ncbi:DUF3000 family protein [Bifidobacterium sp. SMB2]|uniref:DUF3000 family protein n=2 Tax=Bifidobacterium TaxID=1678 RepID=A0ABX0CI14_9BIFI|nr:DUF3000 family protein [Bifidobacterium sp. SMB2]NEH12050.1 DUF3000 family protein [Bifidobacterium saimiriisciurei]
MIPASLGYCWTMAEIYAFPAGVSAMTPHMQQSASDNSDRGVPVPDVVLRAVESVRSMTLREGVSYREIAVPSSMADYGIGVQLDIEDVSRCTIGGWLLLLYRERMQEEWDSHWRCVAFASVTSDERRVDDLTASLTWDWLERMMTGVQEETLGGTVSLNQNTSFGTLARYSTQERSHGCELRVSWTPVLGSGGCPDAAMQIDGWARFLQTLDDNDELEEPNID